MVDRALDAKTRVDKALSDTTLPAVYFNGFALNLGTGDIALVLERNGQPAAVLNTSYTVAKTLAEKLNGLVSVLESKTGNTIMSTEDVTKSLSEDTKDADG